MRQRGFTLLEMLIALGLMVALMALAIPAVWGRTAGARLDGASRQVCAMIVRCREESQRRGEPLALSYSDAGGAWLVIERVSGADSQQGERARRSEDRAESRAGGTEGAGGQAGAPDPGSGVMVEVDREPLPDGVLITLEKPVGGGAAEAGAAGRGGASAVERPVSGASAAGGRGPVRLVVFMPDGSAVMGGNGVWAFYVRTGADSTRALEVSARRWSGGAEVREIDLTQGAAEGGSDERDAPPPPPDGPEKEARA
jgi:prepilin-type N-terminal cleavage/methylation domain-containing protein